MEASTRQTLPTIIRRRGSSLGCLASPVVALHRYEPLSEPSTWLSPPLGLVGSVSEGSRWPGWPKNFLDSREGTLAYLGGCPSPAQP